MRDDIKKMRDRARFERYGGIELIKELIANLPERDAYRRGHLLETAMEIAKRKIQRRSKQKVFLAETIVRYAIGWGYFYPKDNRYFLTKKGRRLKQELSK